MNNEQNENAAHVNAGGVGEVEQMEVVSPHLDPIQQGAIIAALQHQLAQMRVEMNRNRNQHLLGVVQDQNVPDPPVAEERVEEITEQERRRIEGLQRIMRTAPKFHAGSQEPWRAFKLKFSAWRTLSRLDNYVNQGDRKMVLLTCLEGGAS